MRTLVAAVALVGGFSSSASVLADAGGQCDKVGARVTKLFATHWRAFAKKRNRRIRPEKLQRDAARTGANYALKCRFAIWKPKHVKCVLGTSEYNRLPACKLPNKSATRIEAQKNLFEIARLLWKWRKTKGSAHPPIKLTPNKRCCPKQCAPGAEQWKQWRALGFHPKGHHYLQYDVQRKPNYYVIRGVADLDCDGKLGSFEHYLMNKALRAATAPKSRNMRISNEFE